MRARTASTTSTGETFFWRICAASSRAGSQQSSSAAISGDSRRSGKRARADCIIIGSMDPSALPRLRAWLERPEIAALDPRRIEALAAALGGHDPPVRVERWGTVVGYEPGPPWRLVQFDRHGHLIAACRWSPDGALDWARCRAADGRWIGVEPGATLHPVWGRSDRVWLLDGEEPWRPVQPLTVFRSLDWTALDHIPPLAEPQRLPPGAGSAVLNLVASLMKDQGVARVRYRGPFPSEQLFTTLLECFRYDPGQALPLERFMADGGLDWLPAPYESHRVAAWATVQLRQDIDKVVADGVTFYRPEWQGIARESAPALGPTIAEVLGHTALEWGAVPGDLVRAWDTRIRLSARLREAL